jgi:hypothetical protein
MRIAVAALILCLIPPQDAKTSKDPDVRRVTLKVVNQPLGVILADLQKQSGIPIERDEAAQKQIDSDDSMVSFTVDDLTLSGALSLLLLPRGFKVVTVNKNKVLVTTP